MPRICIYVSEAGQEEPVASEEVSLSWEDYMTLMETERCTPFYRIVQPKGYILVRDYWHVVCAQHGYPISSPEAARERMRLSYDWCPVDGQEDEEVT